MPGKARATDKLVRTRLKESRIIKNRSLQGRERLVSHVPKGRKVIVGDKEDEEDQG